MLERKLGFFVEIKEDENFNLTTYRITYILHGKTNCDNSIFHETICY